MNDSTMYCVRCKKHTGTNDPTDHTSSNGRSMRKGRCTDCDSKKSTFVKSGKKREEDIEGGAVSIPDTEREEMETYAKFASASYVPVEERQQYLHNEGLNDYLLDTTLSDVENSVFYNPESKKVVYSARGSVSAKDWLISDAMIAAGQTALFNAAPRYKQTRDRIKQTLEKYPEYSPMLASHSLGSTLTSTAGTELSVPFRGYSTGSSPMGYGSAIMERFKNIFKPSKKKWLEDHSKTYNVITDPISISDTLFPIWGSKHYYTKAKVTSPHSIENYFKPTKGGRILLRKHCPL